MAGTLARKASWNMTRIGKLSTLDTHLIYGSSQKVALMCWNHKGGRGIPSGYMVWKDIQITCCSPTPLACQLAVLGRWFQDRGLLPFVWRQCSGWVFNSVVVAAPPGKTDWQGPWGISICRLLLLTTSKHCYVVAWLVVGWMYVYTPHPNSVG